jgi:hypothetical protein
VIWPNVVLLLELNAVPPKLLNWAELLTKLAVSLVENEALEFTIDALLVVVVVENEALTDTIDALLVVMLAENDALSAVLDELFAVPVAENDAEYV